MISLSEYIEEGLLSGYDEIDDSTDPIKEIEQFIKDNYGIKGTLQISKKPNKNGKYVVNCNKSVEVTNRNITSLINNLFEWGETGGFSCTLCHSLTSLEGAPKYVGGNFSCSHCTSLTSLEGTPKEVDGYFSCNWCTSLTSLEGAPEKVRTDFNCNWCKSLTSLKGAPEKIGWTFSCAQCERLKSLKYAPKEVGRHFCCYDCESLKSLEGAPKEVGKDFCCFNCGKKFTEEDIEKLSTVGGQIKN